MDHRVFYQGLKHHAWDADLVQAGIDVNLNLDPLAEAQPLNLKVTFSDLNFLS